MGWWHAARPPEPACPHGWRHPGPNRGVLTRAARRDGSPELTVILTPRNRGPTRRGQRASPGPIRTPLPNGHRNLLSIVCTQLTKAGAFAGGASGDRIADLDLTVGHDDPHHQPFDQLALLLPGGLIEPLPHTAAELLHAQANARNLALAVDLTLQLLHLGG